MPNVGDELHHFGWNRCSSACHGPDRSRLIVPGFRSSRFHIVNVAIHAANAFLLVLVAWRLHAGAESKRTAAVSAVLCGLVYGMHPALTEPVAWMSCR